MKVEITGRNIEVTPALRRHATQRLEKIARLVTGASSAHVILTVEKHRHNAEVVLVGKGEKLSSTAGTADMYASLNLVLDRVERQARKHRDKLVLGKRRTTLKRVPSSKRPSTRRMREIVEELPEVDTPRQRQVAVVEAEPVVLPPLTVEEAVLSFDSARPFVLFREKQTNRLRVLYRRPDGRFGLLEPQP